MTSASNLSVNWAQAALHIDDSVKPNWWTNGDFVYFPNNLLSENRTIMVNRRPIAFLVTPDGNKLPIAFEQGRKLELAFDWPSVRFHILEEHYTRPTPRSFVSQLPFDYNQLPQLVKSVGTFVWRFTYHSKKSKPQQYRTNLTTHIFDYLDQFPNSNLSAQNTSRFFLTYDTDSGWIFDQDRLFDELIDRLNELKIKATWFVVLEYSRNKKTRDKLDILLKNGHEIGAHGIRHDTKLPFKPVTEIRREFLKWQGFIQDHKIKGFRAPWMISSRQLEEVLPEFFSYDSSVPTFSYVIDLKYPKGCCYTLPFFKQNLLTLPVSLPGDHELMTLRYSGQQMNALWLAQIQTIQKMGGVSVFLGHLDSGDRQKFNQHIRFLQDVKQLIPVDLAGSWLKREGLF